MYKLTSSLSIQRLSDGATIPADARNTDYAAYLEWLASGNVTAEADPVTLPELTPIQKIRAAEAAADDQLKRASRLSSLEVARNKVRTLPAAAPLFVGKNEAEIYAIVHNWCYTKDSDYRILYDLEQYCAEQRRLM